MQHCAHAMQAMHLACSRTVPRNEDGALWNQQVSARQLESKDTRTATTCSVQSFDQPEIIASLSVLAGLHSSVTGARHVRRPTALIARGDHVAGCYPWLFRAHLQHNFGNVPGSACNTTNVNPVHRPTHQPCRRRPSSGCTLALWEVLSATT